MRNLTADARRLFRLILPWVVFVWIALPIHACGIDPAMHQGCPLCPPHSAAHATAAAAQCPTAASRVIDARSAPDPLPVAIGLPFVVVPSLVPRPRGKPLPVAPAPRRYRPLHLEKRVLLI